LIVVGLVSLFKYLKGEELKAPTKTLAIYGDVPDFALTNQDGKPIYRADFLGNPWLVDLIFTHCEGTCPMLTAHLAALQHSLVKTPVKMLSVTVDPNNDTPEILKAYAKNYQADLERWTFATGPIMSIYKLAKEGFHLPLDSANLSTNSPIVHSERFVLVDSKGRIRGYYDGTEDTVQQKVLMDLGDLMREEKGS
jgi:protein SCO1/2